MEDTRYNGSLYIEFILLGFPGFEGSEGLLCAPLLLVYLTTLIANSAIVLVIAPDPSVHRPMHLLICCLSVVDIIVSSIVVPKMLLSFLFDLKAVSLAGCLAQMFLVHFWSSAESTLLLAMAVDRYVAICNPLRYTAIMTGSALLKLAMFALVRSGLAVTTLVILASPLPFCRTNLIPHCYCEHMALVKLACADTGLNSTLGLVFALTIIGFDSVCVLLSYCRIVYTVLKITSAESRRKLFHTCCTHLLVISFCYFTALFSFLTYRVGQVSVGIRVLLSVMYLILPPMANPIIYGMRIREIRERLLKRLGSRVIKTRVQKVTSVAS
ncbi:olfactory receptor 52D1-like [Hemiscyllium ocellatum]|uniref:olfactory receptor 52D1-like n=1 Tax=Hemiscyllium ocellatum TaxID=170820 RepID=UPI00296683E7|nr:olfactory receptor 52D1-like [Hemiscyllium ocellatum]